MELKYKLINAIGKAEEDIIIKTDDLLEITLESVYVLDNLLVSITDGKVKKQLRVKGNKFHVPSEFVKAGTLCMDISMVKGGQAIKTFVCEPLTIVEHNGDLYSHKAYNDIREELILHNTKIDLLIKAVNELKARLNEVTNQIKEIWENEEK